MKTFLGIIVTIVILALIAYAVGLAIPVHQVHVRRINLKQTPEAIYALIMDVPNMSTWNRNLEKVEVLPPIDGHDATLQTFKGGMKMTVVTTNRQPPTHLVRMVKDSGDAFTGSWTYDINPVTDGSEIVLTEEADTRSPLFRLLGKIFGPTKYMDEHLQDIAKHFGETATVR